jgi:3-(3-hydroxy-phenyl)propionate hydroxylase
LPRDDSLVLIAGGGPVGLFCGLLLGREGFHVRIFDNNDGLQNDPRAATTHPGTLEVLGQAGLVEDMARVGLVAPIFQFWDRPTGERVAEFDHAILKDVTPYPYVIQCEQFKTARLLLERIKALPNVEVLFNHEVIGVSQRPEGVTVEVKNDEGTRRHGGAYLIGADGGRSTVRKQCNISFEGFTWPERFVVLTTPFDFEAHRGYCPRSYFADPDEWCNCFKVAHDGPPGLWRTVFPAETDRSEEDLLSHEGVQARLKRFFPSPTDYEVVHRNLYVTHQRVATSFRAGRVCLAGDAAHVNNPIGGMGLNGGLQDAANLCEKLTAILRGEGTDRLLDLYDLQRRSVATDFVQQQSIANTKRLEENDPVERKKKLDELHEISLDPKRAKGFLMNTSMIASQRRAATLTLPDS